MIRLRLEDAATDPDEQEHCVACDQPTPYWTDIRTRKAGDQVPCCPGCGSRLSAAQMPTKAAWMSDDWAPPARTADDAEARAVDAFNAANPAPAVVRFKREGRGHGQRTRTIGPAWLGTDGRAVVRLEGLVGPAPLAWVIPDAGARGRSRRATTTVETSGGSVAAE